MVHEAQCPDFFGQYCSSTVNSKNAQTRLVKNMQLGPNQVLSAVFVDEVARINFI